MIGKQAVSYTHLSATAGVYFEAGEGAGHAR